MFAIALFVVLPALALLFVNWQLALVALGIWALMRPVVAAVDRRGSGELPAPAYLPRWTARRRQEASREHAQWQERFDASS